MFIEISSRNPYFDNLKFILIFLMVLGHFAFENRTIPIFNGICNSIYAFHMPLFIFISGYFSKSIIQQRKSDISSLLIPYLIFEFIHFGFTNITGLGHGHLQFTFPTYQDWYLLSLFTWRLIIPYFGQLNKSFAISVSIIAALCAGFVNNFNEFLSLYRSIYLLPFFVLGYYSIDIQAILNKLKAYRLVFNVLFFTLAIIIFYSTISSNSLGQALSYAFIPNSGYSENINDLYLRSFSLVFSSLYAFLFLFIIPQKRTFFTKFGENTMTVYLTHIFFIWILISIMGPYKPIYSELIGIVFSLGITLLLSSNLLTKLLSPFCNPVSLFKNKSYKK
jgi:fucose 4-O-acetylase-like acetyltransferase